MKKILLVVDDSEMARNYHSYILQLYGFETITAIDGADGLEQLYSHDNIEMIITDINMPKMDGYTFIERIREDSRFADLPLIIISTEDEAQDKQRGFDAGANIYIVKPTDPEEVIANIKLLLG
ncbi:MAG: response regulator [Deltaproteobacteria bacterium]|nr:response regulator [Deltaproteobacteria bacterium]MBF0523639.1 response regulator [Deltaproteobacteria bacterium]